MVENTYQKNRKGGKLDDKYRGPYIIHQSLGKGVYILKTMDGKVNKTKYNIKRLKVAASNCNIHNNIIYVHV